MYLRLDDVDPGDFFGHSVLDLHAWVDFNEVESTRINVHQELDGAGTDVVGGLTNLQCIVAQFLALFFAQIRCGCALNDLLVAALN